jgi:fructan beta-fructosidase
MSKSTVMNHKTAKVVFRDPKVMFHASTASWILILTGGDHVQFYKSTDLIHWTLVSRFGHNHGSHHGTWECPDLIEFSHASTDDGTHVWVLFVSVRNNSPAGGSGMQYFIGAFDGLTFQNLQSPETINWLDYGPDFYAGMTYHNIPQYDGRQIMISWMNNWQYARDVPTGPLWRGQMTIPRVLQLDFNPLTHAYDLRQSPVHELYSYSKHFFTFHRQTLTSSSSNILSNIHSNNLMLLGEFHNITTTIIHLRVRQSSDKKEYTEIKYIGEKNEIELDRSHSGNTDFHPQFRTRFNVPLDDETTTTGVLKLQVLVDRCSIELFINDGKYTMTALVFPIIRGLNMELSVEGPDIVLNHLELMIF